MIFVGVESGAASTRRLASESPIKYREEREFEGTTSVAPGRSFRYDYPIPDHDGWRSLRRRLDDRADRGCACCASATNALGWLEGHHCAGHRAQRPGL